MLAQVVFDPTASQVERVEPLHFPLPQINLSPANQLVIPESLMGVSSFETKPLNRVTLSASGTPSPAGKLWHDRALQPGVGDYVFAE